VAYVITADCIGKKDASCVETCPVDCIHPSPDEPGFAEVEQLFIDPEECIDCDACVEACPHDAVFPAHSVPDDFTAFIERNAAYYATGSAA
jgi:NAD-dependent dihydropyrimidine dehydrogenase PreA subunit